MPEEHEEVEEVALTDNDMAVIEELNSERSGEEIQEETETDLGYSTESDQDVYIAEEDNSGDDYSIGQDYDSDLVYRAQDYGLDPNQFASEEVLRQVIDGFDHGNAQLNRWDQWYQYQYNGQQNAQPGEESQGNEQVQSGVQPFRIDLDDDYDEGLKDAINSLANQMHGHYSQQFEILAGELLRQQEFVGYAQQQQMIESAQGQLGQFNYAVQGLNNSRLFGEIPYEEQDPNSPEARNMESLYNQANVLANGYAASGQQVPEFSELIEQAYRASFGDEIEQVNRDRFNDRMRKASKKRLGSGSSTSRPEGADPEDPVNNPVLKEVYEDMLKENGDL